MAAVAGMVASAMLSVVFKQIGAVIGGQITLQQDFTKDLKGMQATLKFLTEFLNDAERKSIGNRSVQVWLKRLKNAVYDISDMLDEFEADTQLPAASSKKCFKKVILQLPYLGPKSKLANKMKQMKKELKEIKGQQEMLGFNVCSASNEQNFDDTTETSVTMNFNEPVVGRNQEQMKIMDLLSKNIREKFVIFPIYGVGGIGKSTMAESLYKDAVFNEYSRVWVHVSQIFNLKKIGNSIISQVSKIVSQITEMQMIHTRLAEVLVGQNILIVLDDIWEDNYQSLDNLKKMLNVSVASKIMVILTTRNEGTAKNLHTVQPYKLPLLSNDCCWTIIQQNSKFHLRDDQNKLEQIGEDIAKKCGGVALAAKALGNLLREFTSDQWESVRNSNIWNSNIWNVCTSEERHHPVLSSLMLTYSYMSSHLRLCFAYCAIFPKGQKMIMDDLIQQWISLDFIDTTYVRLSPRQLGENYIKQLLRLSFFEHSATGVLYEDVKYLTMHDLVHDFARWVLADELIVGVNKFDNTVESICRYAIFDDCSKNLESYTDSPTKIKALRFLDCEYVGLHRDAFSSAKYIRILDLSNCLINELPDSIGQLKQLRYLNAPKIQHQTIPNCITKLFKLFYLNFSGSTALLSLPDSVGEMESLMYLNLSGCSVLKRLPDSFGRLKKLVHLDLSNCTDVTGVSESLHSLTNLESLDISYCWNIKELPKHLGSLLKLKYLNMSGCDEIRKLPQSFGNLKNLEHLDLSHCNQVKMTPQVLIGLTKLRHLNLSQCGCTGGTMVAQAMSNFAQLRRLHLSGFLDKMCHDESTMSTSLEYICTLSNLEHLDLSCNDSLLHLPECICSLSKLHTLNISDCSYLCSVPESIVQMHSLKMAYAKDCIPFISCFVGQGLNKNLTILPEFAVPVVEFGSNLALFQAVNVTILKIYELERVRSVEEVESIKLARKQSIKHLTLEWTSRVRGVEHNKVFEHLGVEDNKVLEHLEPPRTIESLRINGYRSTLFPDWLLALCGYNFFPNLASVSLEGMNNCIRLPPLGQLPNLKMLVLKGLQSVVRIDQDLYGGAVAFSRLESFTLGRMESLQEWNTVNFCGGDGVSGSMFPSLSKLEIKHCPKLRLKPCPPKADQWTIEDSDGVLSSWGENTSSDTGASSSSSPPATSVTVLNCNLPLHQWRLLHHLPALHRLCLETCKDLTSSPETIQAFSSLQYLSVSSKQCSLAQLPEWLGRLTSLKKLKLDYFELNILKEVAKHLTSLQSLHISHCRRMPQWVVDLISLQRLRISWCEDLCNLQDIMGHTSLKKLDIRYCNGIRSLPESIQQLNLEKLRVFGCSVLELWCESEENKMKLAFIRVKRIGN